MCFDSSQFPTNAAPSAPGVRRGPCSPASGVPADVERQYPNANVGYANLRFGEIGSTM
jgi:cellulose 1,4-beta-cellobiosidase